MCQHTPHTYTQTNRYDVYGHARSHLNSRNSRYSDLRFSLSTFHLNDFLDSYGIRLISASAFASSAIPVNDDRHWNSRAEKKAEINRIPFVSKKIIQLYGSEKCLSFLQREKNEIAWNIPCNRWKMIKMHDFFWKMNQIRQKRNENDEFWWKCT